MGTKTTKGKQDTRHSVEFKRYPKGKGMYGEVRGRRDKEAYCDQPIVYSGSTFSKQPCLHPLLTHPPYTHLNSNTVLEKMLKVERL